MDDVKAKIPLVSEVARATYTRGRSYTDVGFDRLPENMERGLLRLLARPAKTGPKLNQLLKTKFFGSEAGDLWRSEVRQYHSVSLPNDLSLHSYMLPFADKLRDQYVYIELGIQHVVDTSLKDPADTLPGLKIDLRWQHYQFATGLWYAHVPHLTTRSLSKPSDVFDRVFDLFKDYYFYRCGVTFDALPPEKRRPEVANLWLAIYEQTLKLIVEQKTQAHRYVGAVSQRSRASAFIKDDPVLLYGHIAGDELTGQEADRIRIAEYDRFLTEAVYHCFTELDRAFPNMVRGPLPLLKNLDPRTMFS